MEKNESGFVRVYPNDRIAFECTGCADCCRHVYQRVPLESLDVYRLAKYMRDSGDNIQCPDDFLEKYAEPALLHECGYFSYFLNTRGEDEACVFLENNRCMVHEVNPRACRTYPFFVDPENQNYLVTYERTHHFKGERIRVGSWMKQHFSQEDSEFLRKDFGSVERIAVLLKMVPEKNRTQAVVELHRAKYSDFDLDKPFMEQFNRNHKILVRKLLKLIGVENPV